MQIVPLETQHLEDAAALFAARYREQRLRMPVLPARHEDPAGVLPRLAELAAEVPGVVAIEDGRLRGYLIAMAIPEVKGREDGAYCPIWGHAAAGDDRAQVYWRLYQCLAERWVHTGGETPPLLTHAITLYADDGEAGDVWFRNGFGMLVVDALRSLEPLPAGQAPADVAIRQATPDDAGLVLPLARELAQHVRQSPIFLVFDEPGKAEHAAWPAQPAHTLWLAESDGEAIGYMRSQPPAHDVANVVHDPGTISITGAYVRPAWRGRGVAQALLARVVEWARANGYERRAVDFESQNLPGSHFWLRHFQPVCHSLLRRVDERVVG